MQYGAALYGGRAGEREPGSEAFQSCYFGEFDQSETANCAKRRSILPEKLDSFLAARRLASVAGYLSHLHSSTYRSIWREAAKLVIMANQLLLRCKDCKAKSTKVAIGTLVGGGKVSRRSLVVINRQNGMPPLDSSLQSRKNT
jgi:hypothetical protein